MCIRDSLSISLDKIVLLAPSTTCSKGLVMRNLQYQIKICQKSHNTVTNHNYILCMVRIYMNQTLVLCTKFNVQIGACGHATHPCLHEGAWPNSHVQGPQWLYASSVKNKTLLLYCFTILKSRIYEKEECIYYTAG